MIRKIAILGTDPVNAADVPIGEPDWEIWGCARRADFVTRAERWYEVHRFEGYTPEFAAWWRDITRRQCVGIPIYMLFPEADLGDVRRYPYEEIAARFGTFFLTSSPAYMLAHAIDEIVPPGERFAPEGSALGVWGMNAEGGTEYRSQRAGLRHFLQLARHLGFSTVLHADGGLIFEPVPYPLHMDDPLIAKLKLREAKARKMLDGAANTIAEAEKGITRIKAMAEAGAVSDELKIDLERHQFSKNAALATLASKSGEVAEICYWLDYLRA